MLNNTELRNELINHIIDYVNDFNTEYQDEDFSELHNSCFNEDYYIIGYYQASEWLKKHDIDVFDAIDYVINYEKSNFGETSIDINSESIANMLVYILGEELINKLDIELDACNKSELLTAIEEL